MYLTEDEIKLHILGFRQCQDVKSYITCTYTRAEASAYGPQALNCFMHIVVRQHCAAVTFWLKVVYVFDQRWRRVEASRESSVFLFML